MVNTINSQDLISMVTLMFDFSATRPNEEESILVGFHISKNVAQLIEVSRESFLPLIKVDPLFTFKGFQ